MYSKSYIDKLKAHSTQRLAAENISSAVPANLYTPLVQQIRDMANAMPKNLLHRPWSMVELVARLDGKYRAKPHPQKVAEALRILGWKRVRYWKKGYDGVRVWVLPNERH